MSVDAMLKLSATAVAILIYWSVEEKYAARRVRRTNATIIESTARIVKT